MMIHEITALVGKYKKAKRVGRGEGSGHGKTCGRGHNGARSRSGATGSIRASREGGQMPLFRRIPKRGFTNAQFTKRYVVVNIGALAERFDNGAEVNPETLVKAGLITNIKQPVKLLGDGELTKSLAVSVAACSRSATEKITKAGGSVSIAG